MVPASPHTASGETSVSALRIDAKRANSVGICLAQLTLKPGLEPLKPKNGFISRIRIYIKRCVMSHH